MLEPWMLRLRALCLLCLAGFLALLAAPACSQESSVRAELLGLYELAGQWEELGNAQFRLADEAPVEATTLGLELYMERHAPETRSLVPVMANDPIIETIILCGDKAVGHLAEVAADTAADEELRMVALFALGRIGGERALGAVKAVRDDPAWRIRNRAVLALHDIGQADEIVAALQDKHWNVRALAIRALGSLGRKDAIIEFLKTDTKCRNEAGMFCVRYDTDLVVRWIAGHELQERFVAVGEIVQSFLDARGAAKATWANVLGALSDVRATSALQAGLDDPDEAVRLACVDNLYKQARYGELIRALHDASHTVRWRAAAHTGSSGDPLLIDDVAALLGDEDAAIAKDAAFAVHTLRNWGVPWQTDPPGDDPKRQAAWWAENKEKLATRDFSQLGLLSKPDNADIDLQYISRTPRYECDAEKNNPAPGDVVTFTAHIKNAGTKPTGRFAYEWFIDGELAGKGKLKSLEPGATTTLEQTWTWQAGAHTVGCVLDRANTVDEVSEANNALEEKTNAFSVAFTVEKTRYDRSNAEQFYLHLGSNSWEDWAQRQIAVWNFGMQRSVTLLTPEGVVDRARLDRVTVVEDGSLSAAGAMTSDPTADVAWAFPTGELDDAAIYTTNYQQATYTDGPLLREMSRARGLVDLDAIRVRGEDIDVADSLGRRDVDRFLGVEHQCTRGIMMGGDYLHGYSAHSACALNARLNVRTRAGDAAAGDYLSDLPVESTFKVVDVNGDPVPNAVVLVYQSAPDPRPRAEWTDRDDVQIDNEADVARVTDGEGEFAIEGNPFGGRAISPSRGNTVALFKVCLGHESFNAILDVTDFNLAAWNGRRREARFTIPLTLSLTNVYAPRTVRVHQAEAGGHVLTWDPPQPKELPTDPGLAVKDPRVWSQRRTPAYYRIYRRARAGKWESVGRTISTEFSPGGPWDPSSVYAVSAVTRGGSESVRVASSPPVGDGAIQMFASLDDTYYFLEKGRIVTTRPDGTLLGDSDRGAWPDWIRDATAMAPGPGGTLYVAGARWTEQDGAELTGIVVIGPRGERAARYGVPPDDTRALKEPRGIAVDGSGRIIVADTGNRRVVIYNADGTFESELEAPRSARGATPTAVAVGPAGRIGVAYSSGSGKPGSGLVAIFGADGEVETLVEQLDDPVSLALSPDGRLVVAEAASERVRVFDLSRTKPVVVQNLTQRGGVAVGTPVAVSLDRFTRIVVARAGGGAPVVFAPPTDVGVRIEPHAGPLHKEAPNPSTILLTNLSNEPITVRRITSGIGLGGAARQVDLDAAVPFTLRPGLTQRIEALIGFPWEARRGFVPAVFRLETDRGELTAYTTAELHDLIEHRTVVERHAAEPGDRWQRYAGRFVVTSYGMRWLGADFAVSSLPQLDEIRAWTASEYCEFEPGRTVAVPFDALVRLDWQGLRAQVVCVLEHQDKPYVGAFDVERAVPWRMLGPLDNTDGAAFTTAYSPEDRVEIKRDVVMPDGTRLLWERVPDELYDENDGVSFQDAFGEADWKAVYVTTVLSSPARETLFRVGSGDQIVVWLNGTEVLRTAQPGEHDVPVTLRKGNNRILMKICNATGDWGFTFRVTDPDGKPYYDLMAGADADWNPPDE